MDLFKLFEGFGWMDVDKRSSSGGFTDSENDTGLIAPFVSLRF